MTVVGIAVGFRPDQGVASYVVACLVMLLFAFGLSWGFAYVGLAAPNTETAQVMAFPILFPLTFASSCFVNPRQDALVAPGLRDLPARQPGRERGARAHDRLADAFTRTRRCGRSRCSLAIIAIMAPLSIRKFRRGPLRRTSLSSRRAPCSSCESRSMGTRTWSVVSRSRTVTARSSSESKSTVTHHGVPTSSWRR